MWITWKGAQQTAKRNTTVTIITIALFFFLKLHQEFHTQSLGTDWQLDVSLQVTSVTVLWWLQMQIKPSRNSQKDTIPLETKNASSYKSSTISFWDSTALCSMTLACLARHFKLYSRGIKESGKRLSRSQSSSVFCLQTWIFSTFHPHEWFEELKHLPLVF